MNNSDYSELIERAQLGDKMSLDRLAELSRDELFAYIYRIVLQDDLSEDIVQESMVEMFKVLGKLEKADRFWPWLCKIALNKVHLYYRSEWRRKEVLESMACDKRNCVDKQKGDQEGLANLVSQEIKEIVVGAMRELKPRYREALALRCYEGKRFSQIAELMECSELGVRVLFYRAKKALAKQEHLWQR